MTFTEYSNSSNGEAAARTGGMAYDYDALYREMPDALGQPNADLRDYWPDGLFDILLINRTLHMLDLAARHAVLGRMLNHLWPGGWLLLLDERSNMLNFVDFPARASGVWRIERQGAGFLFARQEACG